MFRPKGEAADDDGIPYRPEQADCNEIREREIEGQSFHDASLKKHALRFQPFVQSLESLVFVNRTDDKIGVLFHVIPV